MTVRVNKKNKHFALAWFSTVWESTLGYSDVENNELVFLDGAESLTVWWQFCVLFQYVQRPISRKRKAELKVVWDGMVSAKFARTSLKKKVSNRKTVKQWTNHSMVCNMLLSSSEYVHRSDLSTNRLILSMVCLKLVSRNRYFLY